MLIDQLVLAYGITGQLKRVHALLDQAIKYDPEYPLNYYNLACAYAEERGQEQDAQESLILKGEKMPDPRTDSSFQKYVHDEDFMNLMAKLGYKG